MPSVTLDIGFNTKTHRYILDQVRRRVLASKTEFKKFQDKWIDAEERALAYLPERDVDAARRVKREQGAPQYTTIQIPYSYAVLMASHTYWATVFMSRNPILQYTGRHGESQQQVQAIEALMDYQMLVGEMLVPLYIWLMDVGKYGFGILGSYWDEEISMVSRIVEEEQFIAGVIPTGRTKKRKQTLRVPGYTGNKIYNVRPFDFFPDPRVSLHNFQKGEFCGVYSEMGWNEVLKRKAAGIFTNIEHVKGGRNQGANVREQGSSQLELPDADSVDTWPVGLGQNKASGAPVIKLYECYIELVPSQWGLGKSDYPEKWVFTVTSDFTVVLSARPHGAFHDKYPFDILSLEIEGYALTNRGIPEILEPIQTTLDWLINSHFYNVRKALNDQFVVDPTRVVMKDVLDPLPGGIIRLKPSAYGSDPKLAIQQLQVVDLTQNHLRDIQVMFGIGERVMGVNDQILGALQQGGRKTATEVRTASTFGINRLKTISEFFSASGWGPLSQKLVQNTQQYYELERQFKIAGDLLQNAGPAFTQVTPDSIQGFFDFVPVDGTQPIDRFAQANLWRALLGEIRQTPQIAMQYDLGRIFAWVAQLAGLKNITQFRTQIIPDEQGALAAQQGNVVPLHGSAGPGDLNRVPEPGQISGLGTTG